MEGGSLRRRFSTDAGGTWTPAESVTATLVNDINELSSSHLDVVVDNNNLAHLVFSLFI